MMKKHEEIVKNSIDVKVVSSNGKRFKFDFSDEILCGLTIMSYYEMMRYGKEAEEYLADMEEHRNYSDYGYSYGEGLCMLCTEYKLIRLRDMYSEEYLAYKIEFDKREISCYAGSAELKPLSINLAEIIEQNS